jgi:ParB family chromosome partitioning protein
MFFGSKMSRKQKDYLDDLLASENDAPCPGPENPQADRPVRASLGTQSIVAAGKAGTTTSMTRSRRREGTTLLGRESALARVAAGEVKQVTQLQLDPARVRIWAGNARRYDALNETVCEDLIRSILAEGGQKVPAVVRRVEGDPQHDYEVIAGTRRHWTIAWLRANSYPEMKFLAQVHELDDESAFRLADVENRARKDVTDLERARNYAAALPTYYGNHLSRMADRLKLSKGWLSKMIKVAKLPDAVVDAFADPADIRLKPAYPLAQALEEDERASAILVEARRIQVEQDRRRSNKAPLLLGPDVLKRLLAAGKERDPSEQRYIVRTADGRPAITILSNNRQGVTLRLHAGTGLEEDAIADHVKEALYHLKDVGRGLSR